MLVLPRCPSAHIRFNVSEACRGSSSIPPPFKFGSDLSFRITSGDQPAWLGDPAGFTQTTRSKQSGGCWSMSDAGVGEVTHHHAVNCMSGSQQLPANTRPCNVAQSRRNTQFAIHSIPFPTCSLRSSQTVFPEQLHTVLSLSQTPALLATTPTRVSESSV